MHHLPINPILRYELALVFNRRGAFLRLLAFAGVVALAIFAVWPREAKFLTMRDKISRDALANLTTALQILVLLFGPAYAATTVTRDREQGTLETLSSGAFLSRQILRGKVFAATAYLWMLIGSTLPLALILFLMGGVSYAEFFTIYAELFLWSLMICAFSVRCSALAFHSSEALATAYVHVIPLGAFWVLLPRLYPVWLALPLLAYSPLMKNKEVLLHLRFPFDYPQTRRREDQSIFDSYLLCQLRRLVLPHRRERLMDDWENAVAFSELHYQGLGAAGQALRLLPVIFLSGLIAALVFIWVLAMPALFQIGVVLLLGFFVPALGAAAFTAEADQHTLEALMLTPLPRLSIVAGKLWPPMRTGLVLLALIEGIGLLAGLARPETLAIWSQGAMVAGCAVVLAAAIAVFCSLLAGSTAQAVILSYGTIFLLFAGIPAVCRHLFIYNDLSPQNYAWLGNCSPLMPFLLLQNHTARWLTELAALSGSPVRAYDEYTAGFCILALAASAVLFGLSVARLHWGWRGMVKG